MIEALDDEPLLYAMLGTCRDIILQEFPCLGDGLILAEIQRYCSGGHWFCPTEKTWQEMHWSSYPRLTLPPYWNRTSVSPFLTTKMERGKNVPHPKSLFG
jgi:hypothetical protein